MQLLRTSSKVPMRLGRELGRGGEGAVHPVLGAPNLVAKIYLKPPGATKIEKLRSMTRRASTPLLRVAAWPIDLLTDELGAVRGFLMQKVSAREDIHELYSPKSRKQTFPTVDFRFVVRVAANLARAFAQVHAAGNVIGDVNHGNALVGRDGTVVLIDCDSFQVRDGARLFGCDVGVPLFTAPELQGKPFRGLRRSAEHDAFGLAVLLFHLLYLGRHPFAGRSDAGDIPIERAIAESRFVFGARSAELGMTAPPGTLPLATFGPRIAALFERAFAPPGDTPRPGATEWIEALQGLENALTACSRSRHHFYLVGQGQRQACCWCEIEAQTGVPLFGREMNRAEPLGAARLDELWEAVRAIPAPEQMLAVQFKRAVEPVGTEEHDPLGKYPRMVLSWMLVLLSVICLAVQPGEHWLLALMTFVSAVALRKPRLWRWLRAMGAQESKRARQHAEARWTHLMERWRQECTTAAFDRVLTQLHQTYAQLQDLPGLHERKLRLLAETMEAEQRELHLGLFRIDQAALRGMSRDEIAQLESRGIETAADVQRHQTRLHSFVSKATAMSLGAWASAHANAFHFNPHSIDAQEITRLDAQLEAQQQMLLSQLREGPELLERERARISAARTKWKPQVDEALQELNKMGERESA